MTDVLAQRPDVAERLAQRLDDRRNGTTGRE
jgi:hypothetical protein